MAHTLEEIVEIAQFPDVVRDIEQELGKIYTRLGVAEDVQDALVKSTLEISLDGTLGIGEREEKIHDLLEQHHAYDKLEEAMVERAGLWVDKIESYVVSGRSLDLGGGDGRTILALAQRKLGQGIQILPEVADILEYRDRVSELPYTHIDGTRTNLPSESYRNVVVMTVFHHVGKERDDPLGLVRESMRLLAPGGMLIVAESIYEEKRIGELAYTKWIDWFYNRVLHFDKDPQRKVNVPLLFRTPPEWKAAFDHEGEVYGVHFYAEEDLKRFQTLNPEHHWLFVYQKRSAKSALWTPRQGLAVPRSSRYSIGRAA